MKKLILSAMFLSLFILISCKDDEEEPVAVNPFIGTWELLEVRPIEAQYEDIVLGPLYFFSISQRIIINDDNSFQFRFENNEGFVFYADGDWEGNEEDSTLTLTYSNNTTEEYELRDNRLVGQFSFPVPTEEDPEQTIDILADWYFEKIF